MADTAKSRKRKKTERFHPTPKKRQLAVSKIKAIMDMPFYSVKDHNPKDPKPKKNDLILCYWTELEDRKDKDIVDESISGYYFARVSKPVRDGAVFFSVIFVSTGQELRLTRLTARNGKRKRILPIYDYIKSQQSEFLACDYVRKEFTKKFKNKTPEQKCVWNFMYKYRNRLKRYTRRLNFEGFKMIAKESKGDMNAVKALLGLGEDGATLPRKRKRDSEQAGNVGSTSSSTSGTYLDTWNVGTYLDIVLVPNKLFFTNAEYIFLSTTIDSATEWTVTERTNPKNGFKYSVYKRVVGGFLDRTKNRIMIELKYWAGQILYTIQSIDGYDKLEIYQLFTQGEKQEFKRRFPRVYGLPEDGDQKKAPSSDSDTESEEEEMYKDMGDEYEVMLRKLKF